MENLHLCFFEFQMPMQVPTLVSSLINSAWISEKFIGSKFDISGLFFLILCKLKTKFVRFYLTYLSYFLYD